MHLLDLFVFFDAVIYVVKDMCYTHFPFFFWRLCETGRLCYINQIMSFYYNSTFYGFDRFYKVVRM